MGGPVRARRGRVADIRVRVIAGALRGRRLATPGWDGLRPTSDRLRETVFNILADRVSGAVVLDGCAGTGALGVEAISRGAAAVVFVDRDPRAAALITANLERCAIAGRGRVVTGTLPGALTHMTSSPFDLMLLDPPYECDEAEIGAILCAAAACLAIDGRVVLERAGRVATTEVADLVHLRRVASGDSALDFYGQREI